MTEQAIVFVMDDEELLGILHAGAQQAPRGVLIVVGGPQYRVGSHRQFLLLARALSAAGVPVFRFDYRGMGDSSGDIRDFEQVRDDITAAIDTFIAHRPGMREVVIWGLCDAASAALDYAWRDARVGGLVLLNPWVRTEEGLAKAYLKHYYLQRFISRDLWTGLLKGRVNPLASLRSVTGLLGSVISGARKPNAAQGGSGALAHANAGAAHIDTMPLAPGEPLPGRMAAGWRRFDGPILLILSGDDLTAAEFCDTAAASTAWRGLLAAPNVTRHDLPGATHTFSRREWRDQVARWTLEWVRRQR